MVVSDDTHKISHDAMEHQVRHATQVGASALLLALCGCTAGPYAEPTPATPVTPAPSPVTTAPAIPPGAASPRAPGSLGRVDCTTLKAPLSAAAIKAGFGADVRLRQYKGYIPFPGRGEPTKATACDLRPSDPKSAEGVLIRFVTRSSDAASLAKTLASLATTSVQRLDAPAGSTAYWEPTGNAVWVALPSAVLVVQVNGDRLAGGAALSAARTMAFAAVPVFAG